MRRDRRLALRLHRPRRRRWPAPRLVAGAGRRRARIKEVAAVQGVRSNQLVGYGLVVGLDGTGDQTTQTPFTTQSMQRDAAADGRDRCRRAPTCS